MNSLADFLGDLFKTTGKLTLDKHKESWNFSLTIIHHSLSLCNVRKCNLTALEEPNFQVLQPNENLCVCQVANGIESTGRLPMLYGAGDEHGQSAEATRKEVHVLVSETCTTLRSLS